MRRLGVREVEWFWATRAGSDSLGGFPRMAREFAVDLAVLPSRDGRGRSFQRAMAELSNSVKLNVCRSRGV
jgi:beta-lactamase superfamily II metal-dependent hydrolase